MGLKISVVTVCRNSSSSIKRNLISIKNQNYTNFEHVIVDGASNDNTKEIVNRYKGTNTKWHSALDNGIYEAINKGVGLCSGDIVGFLNSDDWFAHENVLSLIARTLDDSSVHACFGNLQIVNLKNDVHRTWLTGEYSRHKLAFGWMCPHPTFYVKREIFSQKGLFNEKYKISADYEFILRCLSDPHFKTIYIDELLVVMSTGGVSAQAKNVILKFREDLLACTSKVPYPLITTLLKRFLKVRQLTKI